MSQGQQSRVRDQSTNGVGAVEDPSVQTTRRSSPTISVPRIIAGALAAASGAFASSWLGLAGTVTGAIFVSIIVSVGTAVYTPPVERSRDVIQRGSRIVLETLPVPAVNRGSTYVGNDLVETRVVPAEPSGEEPSGEEPRADEGPSEATAQTAAVPPAPAEPEPPAAAATAESLRSRLAWSNIPRHWRRIVATAAVTLVAGFALLTGFELAVGRSAESITGGGGGGTTLGHLVPGNTGHSPAGTPSTTPPSASTPSTGAPTSTLPSTTVPSTSTPPSTPTSTAPTTTSPTTTTPSTGGASARVGGTP
jgi:hypothetical protein